jgi:hypothetical protein
MAIVYYGGFVGLGSLAHGDTRLGTCETHASVWVVDAVSSRNRASRRTHLLQVLYKPHLLRSAHARLHGSSVALIRCKAFQRQIWEIPPAHSEVRRRLLGGGCWGDLCGPSSAWSTAGPITTPALHRQVGEERARLSTPSGAASMHASLSTYAQPRVKHRRSSLGATAMVRGDVDEPLNVLLVSQDLETLSSLEQMLEHTTRYRCKGAWLLPIAATPLGSMEELQGGHVEVWASTRSEISNSGVARTPPPYLTSRVPPSSGTSTHSSAFGRVRVGV